MILEKNNLQTAREGSKSYIELIALYVHPKHSNHLRSHLRAIMALDHRRLIRPGKKSGWIFLRSRSLLYKILPTNLGTCKPAFYTICTSHLRWNSTMRHFFIIKTTARYSISQFCNTKYNLHSFNVQDDRSTRGLLAKPFKKFPKSPIRPAGSHFCSESCGQVFEWTLIENIETL